MSWRPGPLKYWLDLNDSGTWGEDPTGGQGVPVVRSTDVNLDGSWDLEDVAFRSVPAAEVASKRLKVGDLVVVKSSGSAEHLGKTAIVGSEVEALGACFANFVQRLRPSGRADARFVWYVLNSHRAAAEMEALGNTTTGLRNLNGSIIGSVSFPGTPLHHQRAIADFLDTETTRIDVLITKKRRIIDLLQERWQAERDRVLVDRVDVTMVPLARLTDPYRPIVYGIVQAGDHVEHGVPYIKTGDLEDFDPRRLARTSVDIDHQYRRARVHPGDLVIAMRASIGALVEIPESLPHANLTQGTARIAAAQGVSRRWLTHVLGTSTVQEQCQDRAVGSTFRTLNIWDLRRVRVPTPPLQAQDELIRHLDRLGRC